MPVSRLQLTEKRPVFERPKKKGEWLLPSKPVIGERAVALEANEKMLAVLDRRDLSLAVRTKLSKLSPFRWATPDLLVLSGSLNGGTGVWSLTEQRLLWQAKAKDADNVYDWNTSVVSWKSARVLEFRALETGEIERTVDIGFRVSRDAVQCHDLLICETGKAQDSICAVALADGHLVWQRPLVAEARAHRDTPASKDRPMFVTCGSIPGQFIATLGQITYGCSLADGSILWSANAFVSYYWPLVEDGRIPVLEAANTRFVLIDERTGELLCDRVHPELRGLYRQKAGSILGNLVVFASESGHVVAFDLHNGDLVHLELHETVAFWGTTVVDSRLLATATDGNLWIFEGA